MGCFPWWSLLTQSQAAAEPHALHAGEGVADGDAQDPLFSLATLRVHAVFHMLSTLLAQWHVLLYIVSVPAHACLQPTQLTYFL